MLTIHVIASYVEVLERYKEDCKIKAETLVRDEFPLIVIKLNKLLESDMFDTEIMMKKIKEDNDNTIPRTDELTFINNGKKRKLEPDAELVHTILVPTNQYLMEIIDFVKPFIRRLIDHANLIKMWISYLIPRIEDGNNFGVSIQEDTLSEARQVESEAASYLDQISRYFITRGKVISKILKYPRIEDYYRTILELDEKEFISMRLVICELRNQYSSLHDIIIKNLDKIKKPRNANTDNMY